MTSESDERLASELMQARDGAKNIAPPSQGDPTFDVARGYRIGLALHRQLVRRGCQPVGRKIGFTNPATWKEFRLDTPIWAHVYDRTLHTTERGHCTLSLSGMLAPRIEPEVVLKLSKPFGELNAKAVASCVEWVAIGFEVVDSHYPDWRFTAPDAVADFGFHAALVVGSPWVVGSEDPERLVAILEGLRVTLRGSREVIAEGEGRNALGSPLLALCHLASVLAAQPWAPPLATGEVITTGTLTAVPYIRPGESYRVEVQGAPLGTLELELTS